uniref:Immunoglobulin domain-containing protein n=1 Tax=Seriola dumerili TaxID=41447 RepID=A0A3B4UDY8_SERDU
MLHFLIILNSLCFAGTILKVSEEKQRVTLSCPRPVEGTVTWSREINGNKVDLLTADGDREIRHNDQRKRYSSQADKFKSLVILRAVVSDSGTYFCNNEAAAELTVIPSGNIRLYQRICVITDGTVPWFRHSSYRHPFTKHLCKTHTHTQIELHK